MYSSKTLLCSSKFPWARKRISSQFINNLGTRPQKGSPALFYRKPRNTFSRGGLSAHRHNRTYKPVPGPTHSSKADFIVLTHEGEITALSFTYYPSTLRHKQQRPGSYHSLNGNADKLFQVTAVINTYLQHVFPCARKQFFPGTHSEYTTSTIRSYQQEENKYGTLCSTKIKRPDISYVPLKQSRDVQLPS
jgi:hypothetical protein